MEVLNKRLDIIKELFDMLASELANRHSNTLEWIVIILIMVEVFFQVRYACFVWITWVIEWIVIILILASACVSIVESEYTHSSRKLVSELF